MKADELGMPTIIVPYPGPAEQAGLQDIFVYLRPETNGVIAESTILKVVKSANTDKDAMKLIFLANIPGEFILENKIVEQYYSLRLHFAVNGRMAFTPSMASRFSAHYGCDFAKVPILGAFEALNVLGMEQEELFRTWVADGDVVILNGQNIKKIKDLYVVNYDIPALLHKNSKNTDIAMMIFRTSLGYAEVKSLVARMHQALCGIGVLSPQFDAARAFHFSKGPLEQILDGAHYLYPVSGKTLKLHDMSFARWLLDHGLTKSRIISLLRNPIVTVRDDAGNMREENLFQLTMQKPFAECLDIITSLVDQIPMINHGPLLDELEKS